MSETSGSPSRKGLAIFSLGRTRNRDPSKRSSVAYSVQSSGSENHSRNVSHDSTFLHGDDGEAGGVKKLVGKTLGRRRRKKQELADQQLASEEANRGRSVADRGTLENESPRGANTEGNTRGGVAPNGRESSDDDDGGSRSSLITVDDEPAEATKDQSERPPLPSAHPSHVGFLTSSSPLVQTTTIPINDFLPVQLDGTTTPPSTLSLSRMNNLPNAESTTSLSNSLRAPIDGSQKRSPSPVGRLRDALKSKKGASPNTSPERRSKGEGGSTSSLNSFADNRRGSVSSRLGSLFPERSNTVLVPNPQLVATPTRPQTAKLSTVDTSRTPSTPPQGETAPLIVNTPPTPTDVAAPRFSSNRDRGSSDPVAASSDVVTSPSGNMISHRRVRSGSANLGPSKLSNIQSAPLTPTPEHPSPNPNQQTGFFANVFSAAQNAANNLSNSIATTTLAPGSKPKSVGQSEMKESDDPVVETLTEKSSNADQAEEKELAVKTLGMGDLMLSHLGISENSSVANTPTSMKFPEETRGRSESANTNDDPYTNRTVLGAPFTHHNNLETGSTTTFDNQTVIRPSSFYEPSAGERTPPNGSVFEGKSGVQRSGSIKSALGGRRRKRNSSATTGGAIGAAIAAANGSIANPNPEVTGPKITGFAVASKKRNRDFHQLFRSVPDDDYLIEDYSCALQREILAHGRLYVSEGHLCFSSNIFGWVTTLVMSFDEIVSVEKRNTALLFKNGLMISTLHAKNIFASFTSRDSTYDTIVGIWKLGHPSLRSSLNGVRLEETGGGDRTEKYDGKAEAEVASQSGGSESGSDAASGDDVYDEDDEDDDEESGIEQGDGSVQSSLDAERIVSRKPSAPVFANGSGLEKTKEETPASSGGDYPGPATHAATECTDGDTHYAKIIADELIPAPLGKIYNLLFGAPSVAWMRNWLSVEQKCLEVTLDDLPLNHETKTRGYSYIKPLNGSIGPRQTKCVCTETLDFLDFEKSISVTISTQTPDVPSGNVFSTKTKYCLSWGEGNTTRLQMNCAIEWTGKSWLKGPIEKGANDGQVKHAKDLVASLKTAVSSRRPTAVATGKGKKKGRKGRESKSVSKLTDGASDSKPSVEDWGIFEPLHGILGPVVDIFRPLATSNIMYGIIVGLLVTAWFRFGMGGSSSQNLTMFGSSPDRVAAYEEIWRREESELWDWLDDRVGMQRVRDVGSMRVEKQNVEGRLRGERMETREVEAAVRVTEEKLRVLKSSLEEKKGKAREERREGKEEL